MNLATALRADKTLRLALVGAGGKSRLLFRLAGQLRPAVLVSASTHLAKYQLSWADRHWTLASGRDLSAVPWEELEGVHLFTGPEAEDGRIEGLNPELIEGLQGQADRLQIPLVIEADGSRQRPLKAPARHEPAIPDFANHVAVCANLSALGKPLVETWVHRPARFAELSAIKAGQPISEKGLLRVLNHPDGGLKQVPEHARRTAVLTAESPDNLTRHFERLAAGLLEQYHSVVGIRLSHSLDSTELGVVAAAEPVAGIVLAAGGSTRMGSPKQLLEWQGETLVRKAARIALQTGCSPVLVVTGAWGGLVAAALGGLPVEIVHNESWQKGQSTSVRAGVRSLPARLGAAVFLLVDQPQTPVELLKELIAAHRRTLAPVVAPFVQGQRSNPVLFDRVTFPELLTLAGDVGGRSLFEKYPVHGVPWDDPRQLMDVDTMEDYGRLLR